MTLKYKTVEFDIRTRAETVSYDVSNFEQIFAIAKELLEIEIAKSGGRLRLRLMGVRLSSLEDETSPTKRNFAQCQTLMKFVKTKEEKEKEKPSTSKKEEVSFSKRLQQAQAEQWSFFRRKMTEFQAEKQKFDEISSEESIFHQKFQVEKVKETQREKSFFRRKMAEFQKQKAKSEEPATNNLLNKRRRTDSFSETDEKNVDDFEIEERRDSEDDEIDQKIEKRTNLISKIGKGSVFEGERKLETGKRLTVQTVSETSETCNLRFVSGDSETGDGMAARSVSEDSEESTPGDYFCPVCRWNVRCVDLTAFNVHLDSCLSKQAIAEVFKEETTKTKSKIESSNSAVKFKKANKLKKKSGDWIKNDRDSSNSKQMKCLEKFFVKK